MKYAVSFVLCLSLSGCIGPQFLKVQRYKYNEAIQESTAQQLLLNIVRLRYNDSPMFLNVGDIDAKFTLESSSGASGTINENVGAAPLNANSATVELSSKFSNSPNIKLRPMQDADFVRLLEPLTSGEMLALATKRGSLYEYLALTLQSFTDNKKTLDAYRNTCEWKEFLKRLKNDEKSGHILIESNTVETRELLPSYPASKIRAEDVIEAKLAGLMFKEKKDEKGAVEYVLVGARPEWTLTLKGHGEKHPETGILSSPEMRIEFAPGNAFESRDEDMALIPESTSSRSILKRTRSRSIVQMMYCLSLGVEVPPPHKPEWDEEERDGLSADSGILAFKVWSKDHPPRNAFVSVKYRGHWFYIMRADKNSKKFFSVLTELFVERAGKAATTPTILPL